MRKRGRMNGEKRKTAKSEVDRSLIVEVFSLISQCENEEYIEVYFLKLKVFLRIWSDGCFSLRPPEPGEIPNLVLLTV
jgi:hypothetical protein